MNTLVLSPLVMKDHVGGFLLSKKDLRPRREIRQGQCAILPPSSCERPAIAGIWPTDYDRPCWLQEADSGLAENPPLGLVDQTLELIRQPTTQLFFQSWDFVGDFRKASLHLFTASWSRPSLFCGGSQVLLTLRTGETDHKNFHLGLGLSPAATAKSR